MVTKVTTYFHAGDLFEIAKRSARAGTFENDGPIISIMFSVIALEAFINESVSLARSMPTAKTQKIVEAYSNVMSELEQRKEGIVIKYHLGLLVFSGATWDEGIQPFQDFKLLIVLRNAITHAKSDEWSVKLDYFRDHEPQRDVDEYPKFIRTLLQRGFIEKPLSSESWLVLLNNPKVANWACKTAETITKKFFEAVPKGYYKESLKTHLLCIDI